MQLDGMGPTPSEPEQQPQTLSGFDLVEEEMIHNILQHLNLQDVATVTSVSRLFNQRAVTVAKRSQNLLLIGMLETIAKNVDSKNHTNLVAKCNALARNDTVLDSTSLLSVKANLNQIKVQLINLMKGLA